MKIKILGSGQDAGIPHAGCYCKICNKARKNVKSRRLAPSMTRLKNFVILSTPRLILSGNSI